MVDAILFRMNRRIECTCGTEWPVIFRSRRVYPGFRYGDDLRFPLYCWDLVLSEAVVEHCKQPLVSIGPKIV